MKIINSYYELKEFINNNSLSVIYFSTNTCTACNALKPKVISLINEFKDIKIAEVKADKSIELVAQLNMFMVPAILFFVNGKETLRESKYISISELKNKLERIVNLYER